MERNTQEILLNKIIKRIKEEKKYIDKANQVDKKHYKMKVNINRVIQIVENIKNMDVGGFKSTNIIVTHNGNPYISLILAIKAIYSNTNLEICVNETMLATNSVIIKIIEEVLKELKINLKINISRILNIEDLKNKKNNQIIVLQDLSQYSMLKKEGIKNISYNPIFNVALYIDDEEFEDIKQDILNYCYDNFIEIEIYEADDIEDAIEQFEADNQGEYVLILTKKIVDAKKINEKIEININKNILTDLEEKIIFKEL